MFPMFISVSLKNSLEVLQILCIIFSWEKSGKKGMKIQAEVVPVRVLRKKSGAIGDDTISFANGTCEKQSDCILLSPLITEDWSPS